MKCYAIRSESGVVFPRLLARNACDALRSAALSLGVEEEALTAVQVVDEIVATTNMIGQSVRVLSTGAIEEVTAVYCNVGYGHLGLFGVTAVTIETERGVYTTWEVERI